MLDIGFLEIVVIGALALIVVGPKDLPGLLRTVGQFVGKAKAMARDFQRTMEEAARDADMGDVADVVQGKKKLNSLPFDTQVVDSLKEFEKSVKSEVGDAAKAAETSVKEAEAAAGGATVKKVPPAKAAPEPSIEAAAPAVETPINAPADAPRMTPDSGKADPSAAPASATKSA